MVRSGSAPAGERAAVIVEDEMKGMYAIDQAASDLMCGRVDAQT